ncbi:MAG TPA: response regulator transcription factor, partial [Actinomycetota bacterium]|nr:response regulator transcription factor [Actinomycetota bacterium]
MPISSGTVARPRERARATVGRAHHAMTTPQASEGLDPRRPPTGRLGVVVVDPLPVVRAGLSLLIGDRPDIDVLAEAGTAEEAVEAVRRIRRSQVVMLVGLGLDGEHDSYWLIRTVRERFPGIAVLACGAKADPTSISRALFTGADGFVDKNADPVEFLQSLRRVA